MTRCGGPAIRCKTMAWYAFPEASRRYPAPDFCLLTSDNRWISRSDYRDRANVVLVFVHAAGCNACRQVVVQFARHYADYLARTAEVLVVWPGPVRDVPVVSLPGALHLIDVDGMTRQAYAALLPEATADDVLIFVLDHYGAPYAALATPEADAPGFQQEVLEWLAFIEAQCPE